MPDHAVTSPCTSICTLNDEDVCVGCYRTAKEIQDWRYLNNDQRQDVLVLCGERRGRVNP
jgi:predicted Fe-S protein YdhL (DUF1289 family)